MSTNLIELLLHDMAKVNLVEKRMETMDSLEDILVWEARVMEAISKKKLKYYKKLDGITELAEDMVEGYLGEDLKEYHKFISKFIKIVILTTFQNKLKDQDSKFILETEIEIGNDLIQIIKDEKMLNPIMGIMKHINSVKTYANIMNSFSINTLDILERMDELFLDSIDFKFSKSNCACLIISGN